MGLPQPLVIQKDHGVGGDDDGIRRRLHRLRLLPADVGHDILRRQLRGIPLLHVRHGNFKFTESYAPQQLLPPGGAGGQYDPRHSAYLPVEPKPPEPRSVSSSSSTTVRVGRRMGSTISWAMRSPGWMV